MPDPSEADLATAIRDVASVARDIARRTGKTYLLDELESAGLTGVEAAIRGFRPEAGGFVRYARIKTAAKCWDAVRAWAGRDGSRAVATGDVEDRVTARSAEDEFFGSEEIRGMAARIAGLGFKRREAVLGYARGETMAAVARRIGVTEGRVSQLRLEACRELGVERIGNVRVEVRPAVSGARVGPATSAVPC